MAIEEVFSNPTVKNVAFEIKFPNLFYLESRIGELQIKIMEEFPESNLLFRRKFLFADVGPTEKVEEIQEQMDKEWTTKVWNFTSPKNFELNISTNSLVIRSAHHKTYNLEDGDKFRDIIKFVIDNLIKVISIPIIKRIGLRYTDECPIPSKDNSTFRTYYNSVFPLERFDLANANEMDFKAMVKKGNYYLRFAESLKKIKDEYKLILDFDGFAYSINPKEYLSVTDELHKMISDEFEITIKEPLKEYMRKPKED